MSRDPLGIWGDPEQLGNGQSYCGNGPVNLVDPKGLSEAEAAKTLQDAGVDPNRLKSDDYLRSLKPEQRDAIDRALRQRYGRDYRKTDEFRRLKKVQKAKGARGSSLRRGGGTSGRAGRIHLGALALLGAEIAAAVFDYLAEKEQEEAERLGQEIEDIADDFEEFLDESEEWRKEYEKWEQEEEQRRKKGCGGEGPKPPAPPSPAPPNPPTRPPSGPAGFPRAGGWVPLPR